ncbi:hypothetical protein ACKKBF_B34855 [Auxenochlorella protothecoides x Auxenochlorella symbiontica]
MAQRNLVHLLVQRESGQAAVPGRLPQPCQPLDEEFSTWKEDDFVNHCSAQYCAFSPAPRSTIAVAYNADGTLLASSHGDHTVKISCCRTNLVLRSLAGHSRTPWVVRFHPRLPHLVASGSLDHQVRLWNAHTGECLAMFQFGKPIASLSFHISSPVIAVACGHRLFLWEFGGLTSPGDTHASSLPRGKGPVSVLRTRRSLRACAFHPRSPNLLLSAEVQDSSAPEDLTPAHAALRPFAVRGVLGASSSGRGPHPPDAPRRPGGVAGKLGPAPAPGPAAPPRAAPRPPRHLGFVVPGASAAPPDQPRTPDAGPGPAPPLLNPAGSADLLSPLAHLALEGAAEMAGSSGAAPAAARAEEAPGGAGEAGAAARAALAAGWVPPGSSALPPSMVPTGWEVPFGAAHPPDDAAAAGRVGVDESLAPLPQIMAVFSAVAWNIVGEEQPARVTLRLWSFDPARPTASLEDLRLQVPDAVLCSEMGVSFSPCGRYLAAAVACRAGTRRGAPAPLGTPGHGTPAAGVAGPPHPSGSSAPGSEAPAPPPVPPGAGVAYEVRVLGLRAPWFGLVLRARRVHAAHCLTSVQFSPCSRHLLLAYGKKHVSLLRSLVHERGETRPMHTILEVVRLADGGLARVLPSCEDEINAACWHPHPGGGVAYGTKEGRLRVVTHDRADLCDEHDGSSGAPAPPTPPPGSGVLLQYMEGLAATPVAALPEPVEELLRRAQARAHEMVETLAAAPAHAPVAPAFQGPLNAGPDPELFAAPRPHDPTAPWRTPGRAEASPPPPSALWRRDAAPYAQALIRGVPVAGSQDEAARHMHGLFHGQVTGAAWGQGRLQRRGTAPTSAAAYGFRPRASDGPAARVAAATRGRAVPSAPGDESGAAGEAPVSAHDWRELPGAAQRPNPAAMAYEERMRRAALRAAGIPRHASGASLLAAPLDVAAAVRDLQATWAGRVRAHQGALGALRAVRPREGAEPAAAGPASPRRAFAAAAVEAMLREMDAPRGRGGAE